MASGFKNYAGVELGGQVSTDIADFGLVILVSDSDGTLQVGFAGETQFPPADLFEKLVLTLTDDGASFIDLNVNESLTATSTSTQGVGPYFEGEFTKLRTWTWSDVGDIFAGHDDTSFSARFVGADQPAPDCDGTEFKGRIVWPYLDAGPAGLEKQMEGFDAVVDGSFNIRIGYDQSRQALATEAYDLDGDTLTAQMIPMPVSGPSFQMRFEFDGNQPWEWFATNLYLNDNGIT